MTANQRIPAVDKRPSIDVLRQRAEMQAYEMAPTGMDLSTDEGKKFLHELRVHQIELEIQNEELRRAQIALDALRARYFSLYDLAPVGYVSVTDRGVIFEANLRFSVLVGIPRAKLTNQPLSHYIFVDDQDIFYLHRKKLFETGEHQTFELRMKRADGTPFWARIEAARASAEDDQDAYCRLTATDISEQREIHEALANANRLASMGLLAAGLAHEINNPLTAVLYNTKMLAEDLPAIAAVVSRVCRALQEQLGSDSLAQIGGEGAHLIREPALADLGKKAAQASAAAHRVHEVMKGVTLLSRPPPEAPSPTDVNKAAQDAITVVANEIKYCANLICDLGEVRPVMASVGLLSQVFVNLLINAAHAIPEGERERNRISVRTWSEGDRVVAEVSDTGCGIPLSDLRYVFEPFFTTKGGERGTGLGLAISRRIVSELGGDIDIESTVQQGTRVVFRLPACHVAPEPASLPAAATTSLSSEQHPRILVVDDEEMVRSVVSAILEREHEVVTVESGREARKLLLHDLRFDLILCDLMMSDVSGIELHAWLVENHPKLAERVVFLTGGVFTPATHDYLGRLSNTVIQKPFYAAALLKQVRDFLADHDAP